MRKFVVPVAFVGLLALLLAGDALPQFGGGGGRDPGALFDRLAKGKPYLAIADSGFFQERLAAYAQQHGLYGGQVTRDQFSAFLAEMRQGRQAGPGGAPAAPGGAPGKGPGGGMRWANNPDLLKFRADREFRQMDVNKDGYLDSSEIPAAVHDAVFMFDKNGDGLIDPHEFLEYVQARTQGKAAGGKGGQQWDVETVTPEAEEQRPVVFRAGKLPKDLPAWFEQYDLNRDGQVSLYEWRMAKEPIEEFLRRDRNDDGFLTAEEVLRYEKLAKAAGPGAGIQTAAAAENPAAGPGQGGKRQGKGGWRKGGGKRQQQPPPAP
jgi:Ca2+-binding EF-hand superfamily protein